MRVSFISALHNNLALTKAMYSSLLKTVPDGLDAEFIFVDNASRDGTDDWLKAQKDPRLQFEILGENIGYGPANNFAAEKASGEILVLLNNDIELTPGWLEPMLEGFAVRETPGFIGNLQFRFSDGGLDHRGVRFDLLRRPYHVRTRRLPYPGGDFAQFPAVTAACCAIRRDVFLETGGFDPAYNNGYEDIDLCLKLGRAGYKHYVANRSRVFHHVSSSPGRFSRESANLKLFLDRWGWPGGGPSHRIRGLNYIGRHWLRPWRYNGGKLVLAVAWLISGKPCTSLQEHLQVTIEYKPR